MYHHIWGITLIIAVSLFQSVLSESMLSRANRSAVWRFGFAVSGYNRWSSFWSHVSFPKHRLSFASITDVD